MRLLHVIKLEIGTGPRRSEAGKVIAGKWKVMAGFITDSTARCLPALEIAVQEAIQT